VRSAMGEAEAMAASVEKAGTSLDAMLQTADGLLRRYDALVTDPAAPRARPFDVREYTAGVKELAGALQNMNDVLKSSDALLASAEWDRRMQDVNRSADARMKVAAEQSQVVVTAGFRQLWLTVAVVLALLILYRLAGFYLSRRRRADVGARGMVTAANGNGRTGRPPSLAAAGDGTFQTGVQS
jgi:hypothetical protein